LDGGDMLVELKRILKGDAYSTIARAQEHSLSVLERTRKLVSEFSESKSLRLDNICFVVVGSLGRLEALEASDLDLIPICKSANDLQEYGHHDKELRKHLLAGLGVKVSRGEDLTKATSLEELIGPECIGGSKDDSGRLTKRVLVLTESRQAGGGYPLSDLRKEIVDAYAKEDRTSGRHVLSLCNDFARYFKTLCIEYKAKIDDEEKDWCTRNMKLRHSRKFWYFSNIISIVTLSEKHPLGDSQFVEELLGRLNNVPIERLVIALKDLQPISLSRLVESYALFLAFMAKKENRIALATVEHSARYEMVANNPFPAMKFNSDSLHNEMLTIVEQLGFSVRSRLVSWFLF
jgi:hypothetical protein